MDWFLFVNGLRHERIKEGKLSFLIVDIRSLFKKPRRDKHDFTAVEQFPIAPTSTAKDEQTNC